MGNSIKILIANVMAKVVINLFKVIQIKKQKGELFIASAGGLDKTFNTFMVYLISYTVCGGQWRLDIRPPGMEGLCAG